MQNLGKIIKQAEGLKSTGGFWAAFQTEEEKKRGPRTLGGGSTLYGGTGHRLQDGEGAAPITKRKGSYEGPPTLHGRGIGERDEIIAKWVAQPKNRSSCPGKGGNTVTGPGGAKNMGVWYEGASGQAPARRGSCGINCGGGG